MFKNTVKSFFVVFCMIVGMSINHAMNASKSEENEAYEADLKKYGTPIVVGNLLSPMGGIEFGIFSKISSMSIGLSGIGVWSAEVKNLHVFAGIVGVAALIVAYKKGYLKKLKNYCLKSKSAEKDINDHKTQPKAA